MSFHGALIACGLAILLFARHFGVSARSVMDVCCAAVPFGLITGRLGNFINSEHWGRAADVPWAMVFPNGGDVARHPSQLYEALLEGVVMFIITRFVTHTWLGLKQPGLVTGVWLVWYAIARTICEFFREPEKVHASQHRALHGRPDVFPADVSVGGVSDLECAADGEEVSSMSQPLVIIHFITSWPRRRPPTQFCRCFISSIAEQKSLMIFADVRRGWPPAAHPRDRSRCGHDVEFGGAGSGYPKLCIGDDWRHDLRPGARRDTPLALKLKERIRREGRSASLSTCAPACMIPSMATMSGSPPSAQGRLHHRTRDQPDLRRTDRPVVRGGVAADGLHQAHRTSSNSAPAAAR